MLGNQLLTNASTAHNLGTSEETSTIDPENKRTRCFLPGRRTYLGRKLGCLLMFRRGPLLDSESGCYSSVGVGSGVGVGIGFGFVSGSGFGVFDGGARMLWCTGCWIKGDGSGLGIGPYGGGLVGR